VIVSRIPLEFYSGDPWLLRAHQFRQRLVHGANPSSAPGDADQLLDIEKAWRLNTDIAFQGLRAAVEARLLSPGNDRAFRTPLTADMAAYEAIFFDVRSRLDDYRGLASTVFRRPEKSKKIDPDDIRIRLAGWLYGSRGIDSWQSQLIKGTNAHGLDFTLAQFGIKQMNLPRPRSARTYRKEVRDNLMLNLNNIKVCPEPWLVSHVFEVIAHVRELLWISNDSPKLESKMMWLFNHDVHSACRLLEADASFSKEQATRANNSVCADSIAE